MVWRYASTVQGLCSHFKFNKHNPLLTTPNLKFLLLQLRPLCDLPQQTQPPFDPAQLLRVCTVLYQQQHSPDARLYSHLLKCNFQLSHEFFLQVCNRFPYSWRPVHRFFKFTQMQPTSFAHTPVSYNKMVDVFGKAKNMDLLWEILREMGHKGVVNDQTFRIAIKAFASARELKKCVELFHFMNTARGLAYSVERLNKVVQTLCSGAGSSNLVFEARYVVFKLKECIKPNVVTYKHLIIGFCHMGELIEASKIWNILVDEKMFDESFLSTHIDVIETMMDTFFKKNQFDEALKLFRSLDDTNNKVLGLSTYRLAITWMCKREKLSQAYFLFEEMTKRGIRADNSTLAALIYGLLTKRRIREAYKILHGGIEKPDIIVYHGLIKGLLRIKMPGEATKVFREMIKKGCEPTMHTYVMLLQGHLGKRGRKGPHSHVNFETIFVGGLVKLGKSLEATKYVERTLTSSSLEVPRFDYNKFLHSFSNEQGAVMFEEVSKRLREVGLVDLADIFQRYGEKMTTRDRRRQKTVVVDDMLHS